MKFAQLKESVRLCCASKVSVIIWGHRGIGKSQCIKQITDEGEGETALIYGEQVHLPTGLIDFRCSQIEASDLRGMPDKQEGRTVYLPPEDLPVGDREAADIEKELLTIENEEERRVRRAQLQRHYKRGILFLDEPNRAQDDVLQAVFQLILDRRIGQYILPTGWSIALAANYMEGDYITNGFTDAALLDRMCHLQLVAGEQTLDDWCTFMAGTHGEHAQEVIQFCASNTDYLVGQPSGELGFTVQPSPRSWDMVVSVIRNAKEGQFSDEAKQTVIQGLVGIDCGNTYETFSCPVQPRDLITDGVRPWEKTLSKLRRNELLGVSWGLISLIRDRMDEEKIVSLSLDVAECLVSSPDINDKDVIIAYLRALLSGTEDEFALTSCITNRNLAEQIVNLSEDANLLLTQLCARKELHEKLAVAGWGEVS